MSDRSSIQMTNPFYKKNHQSVSSNNFIVTPLNIKDDDACFEEPPLIGSPNLGKTKEKVIKSKNEFMEFLENHYEFKNGSPDRKEDKEIQNISLGNRVHENYLNINKNLSLRKSKETEFRYTESPNSERGGKIEEENRVKTPREFDRQLISPLTTNVPTNKSSRRDCIKKELEEDGKENLENSRRKLDNKFGEKKFNIFMSQARKGSLYGFKGIEGERSRTPLCPKQQIYLNKINTNDQKEITPGVKTCKNIDNEKSQKKIGLKKLNFLAKKNLDLGKMKETLMEKNRLDTSSTVKQKIFSHIQNKNQKAPSSPISIKSNFSKLSISKMKIDFRNGKIGLNFENFKNEKSIEKIIKYEKKKKTKHKLRSSKSNGNMFMNKMIENIQNKTNFVERRDSWSTLRNRSTVLKRNISRNKSIKDYKLSILNQKGSTEAKNNFFRRNSCQKNFYSASKKRTKEVK